MAFFKVWKLQWHFSDTPDLEWYLSNEPKTKVTRRAAGSLVSAARCAILSFIDYVDNGMGPRCQKSTGRSHFFYWLEIRRHLLAYCHDLGGSPLSSSPRTIIS